MQQAYKSASTSQFLFRGPDALQLHSYPDARIARNINNSHVARLPLHLFIYLV